MVVLPELRREFMGSEQRRNWEMGIGTSWLAFAMLNPLKWANPVLYFISVGVSMILTQFFQPKDQKRDKESQSYNWKREGNLTASHDLPLPVVYGKTRVTPIIKNSFVTIDGSKEYLSVLYSFTGHKIDDLSYKRVIPNVEYSVGSIVRSLGGIWDEPGKTYMAVKPNALGSNYAFLGTPNDTGEWIVWDGSGAITNIEIDGNPLNDYLTGNNDDIYYETRQGLANQTFIPGFNKTYANIPQSQVLTNDPWITVQTSSLVAQNIELTLLFPNGLFDDVYGQIDPETAEIFVQYREIGSGKWLNFEAKDWNTLSAYYTYDVGTEPDETNVSIYDYHKWTAQAFYVTITAKSEGEYLEIGKQYEIRIKRGIRSNDVIQLVNVATISYAQGSDADGSIDGLSYPGESLLGIRIRATETLKESINLTGIVERSTVKVYDGTSWVDKPANNHAWAVYDMLANGHPDHPCYPNTTNDSDEIMSVYGAGVDKDRIDYASFNSWAAEITTLGYELNIVFDSFTTVWEAILKICVEGRGIVFPVGSKYKALPDIATTASNLFCMGNIDLGSFKKQWIDKSKKANTIEITFFDEDRDYERSTFVVRTSDWDTSTELKDAIRLVLNGTTNYKQAVAIGTYYLNCNELLNQIVSFVSDVESLDLEVGDVIYVQHDILTGFGGKVDFYANGPDIIYLDKEVTVAPGKTYSLYVQRKNGTIDVQHGITGNFTRNYLSYDLPGGEPAKYDNWAFGETGSAVKEFRVVDISRNSEYKREIACLEYNEAVYNSLGGGNLGTGSINKIVPNLDQPDQIPFNTAQTLKAYEVLSRNRATGEYESSIHVSWQPDEGVSTGEWEVSYRDVDANDPGWKGEWESIVSYDKYERVEHNGYTYISLADNNLGTEPFNR